MRKFSLLILTLLSLQLAPQSARADDEILIKYFDIAEGRLAFTYLKDKKKTILVLDLAALEATPLQNLSGNNESPRFSPDGERILFVSDRSGKKEIYVAHSDGSNQARIAAVGAEEFEPDWSPDGKQITFAATSGSSSSDIYIANIDGSSARSITSSKKLNRAPRWSPKGDEIVFVTNEYWPGTDLLSYSLTTKKISILTTGYASSTQPSFSRDASQFTYVTGPVEDLDIMQSKKGEKAVAIINRGGRDMAPEWFDNNNKLWFLGENTPGTGHMEIFLHNVEKKEDIQLTECTGTISDLSWTPTSGKSKKSIASSGESEAPQTDPAAPSSEAASSSSSASSTTESATPTP